MAQIKEGQLLGAGLKIGIVIARFNEFIGSRLLGGAYDALHRHGVNDDDITESGKYDAVICLGAVIRGATSHYDLVCNEVAKGIAQISLHTGRPVLFGVVTTENIEQAVERAGTKAGNKGFDVAVSAIEMANLLKEI